MLTISDDVSTWQATAVFSVLFAACGLGLVWRAAPAGRPFGLANGITALRLVLACGLAGATTELTLRHAPASTELAATELGWALFMIALSGMVLDGVDGYVARKLALVSDFGARFDMEVDAFHILVLSVLAAILGKAGWWVLMSGMARYGYVAAGVFWPQLNAPLPPSWRRKVVAVVQGGALTLLMAPLMAPPVSGAVAAIALVVLLASFAKDVAWCFRHG